MKVMVATAIGQGLRASDFTHCLDGELVTPLGTECDGEPVDGVCGCRRAFSGLESGRATTTAVIEERPYSEETYRKLIADNLREAGLIGMHTEQDDELVTMMFGELTRTAAMFERGMVIERRGNTVQERRLKAILKHTMARISRREDCTWTNYLGSTRSRSRPHSGPKPSRPH